MARSLSAPVDRSAPPPPAQIQPFRFPRFLHRTLPSGLEVYAARQIDVPLLSLELVLPAGGEHDPAGRAGLATLTASLLDEGTARRSTLQLAGDVERLGGSLSTGADWDVGYLMTGLLAQHRSAGIELLAEVALSPTFPQGELERLTRLRKAEILRRSHLPSALADERLAAVVYRGTPYASSLLGTEASIDRFDRDQIVAFYRRHCTLRGAAFLAVGDLDPEAIVEEIAAAFAAGPTAAAPAAPAIDPQPLPGIEVHVVDRPGAAQTELRLGHVGIVRSHPDYSALVFLNTVLGGKFTSRINLSLRERHGYTYGASSRIAARRGPGPFVVSSAVATESAGPAAREVLVELRRIRDDLVRLDELDETRSYMLGVFPYTVQTIGDLAKRLEDLAIYGLPDDHLERYEERVSAVTRERLLEVARRHLHPERIAIVAVGPADVLRPQFDGLGEVTVWPQAAQGSRPGLGVGRGTRPPTINPREGVVASPSPLEGGKGTEGLRG